MFVAAARASYTAQTMAPIFRSILRFLPPVQLQLRMKVLYSQPFSTQSSLDRIPQKPRRSNAQPDDVLHHPCAFAAPGSIWRVNLQSLRSLLNAGSEDKEVIRYASQPSAQIIILPQEKEESSATTASSTSTSKGPTKAVLEKVRAAYAPRCRVIPLAKSGWAQCLRNVPAAEKVRFAKQQRALQRRQKLNKASEKAGDVAVDEVFCIVASINSTCQLQLCHAHSRCGCCHCGLLQGRVLVLDRLKFRGNIGCIIRSAVQVCGAAMMPMTGSRTHKACTVHRFAFCYSGQCFLTHLLDSGQRRREYNAEYQTRRNRVSRVPAHGAFFCGPWVCIC